MNYVLENLAKILGSFSRKANESSAKKFERKSILGVSVYGGEDTLLLVREVLEFLEKEYRWLSNTISLSEITVIESDFDYRGNCDPKTLLIDEQIVRGDDEVFDFLIARFLSKVVLVRLSNFGVYRTPCNRGRVDRISDDRMSAFRGRVSQAK